LLLNKLQEQIYGLSNWKTRYMGSKKFAKNRLLWAKNRPTDTSLPPHPHSAAQQFIDKLTKPAGGILRAPVRRPRQGKATATEVVPQHSRRVAGVGVERLPPPPPTTQGKKRILKELGIVNAEETETIRPEDLDEYARVFSKGLLEVQITAMATLFGWSRPMELLQGGPIC
jgi:hypothetical protein